MQDQPVYFVTEPSLEAISRLIEVAAILETSRGWSYSLGAAYHCETYSDALYAFLNDLKPVLLEALRAAQKRDNG